MTAADLQRVEAAIGRSMPAAVRQFFLNFPRNFGWRMKTATRTIWSSIRPMTPTH
jgi:hypothetical protein